MVPKYIVGVLLSFILKKHFDNAEKILKMIEMRQTTFVKHPNKSSRQKY
jgi:hypothetical protein